MPIQEPCWVCGEPSRYENTSHILFFDCIRCGDYSVDLPSVSESRLRKTREIANASSWIRENPGVQINQLVMQKLKNLKAPSVNERAEKLLQFLDSKTEFLGQKIPFPSSKKELWSICWVLSAKEISYLIYYLSSRGFINNAGLVGSDALKIEIKPDGFTYLDENKKIQSNIGFCAMSFASDLTDVWQQAISPAITDAGYDPVRIDGEEFNTGIVDQIKAKIRQSKFVIADLTKHRNGVYYEAGFAEGLGQQVILTCREDDFEEKHFDVQHINIIKWMPQSLSDFKKKLQGRIEGTLGRGTK